MRSVTWGNGCVGAGLGRSDRVLPRYGIDRGEEAREQDVLLPGDLRAGRRQAAHRGPAVPGQRRGGDGPVVGVDGGAPERTQHKKFGDLAAVWGILERLGVIEAIDEVCGPRRADAGASVGTYLALATLNRVVAPCSKLGFAPWWATTAGPRFTKVPVSATDHRRFWDAMDALDTCLIHISEP